MSDFFDRLFAKEPEESIRWSVHTTMTCDTAYTAALLEKQLDCRGELGVQLKNKVRFSQHMGVFYHWDRSAGKRCAPSLSVSSKSVPVKEINAIQFGVSASATLHAKLSLVCVESKSGQRRYRLALYTKNMEFNDACAEAAVLLELVQPEGQQEPSEDVKRLKAFFKVLYDNAEKAGQSWLNEHGLTPDGGSVWTDIACCRLVDRSLCSLLAKEQSGQEDVQRPVSLFFGGCGDALTLGERLKLQEATASSIVLTPPFFLYQTKGEASDSAEQAGTEFLEDAADMAGKTRQADGKTPEKDLSCRSGHETKYVFSKAWKYFEACAKAKKGPQLYDLDPEKALKEIGRSSSHIKAYLLERQADGGEPTYAFWIGSANATARGIGWDFGKALKNPAESIECLAKFDLEKEEFETLREAVSGAYTAFSFDPKDSRLKMDPDGFGPYFCNNYKATAVVYRDKDNNALTRAYATKARFLEISFRCLKQTPPGKPFRKEQMVWHPAEYGFYQALTEEEQEAVQAQEDVTLRMEFNRFKPTQGVLCFGTGNCTMTLDDHLLGGNIPQVASAFAEADLSLTEWLLDPGIMEDAELAGKPDELQWMHQVLTQETVPADLPEGKREPAVQPPAAARTDGAAEPLIRKRASEEYLRPKQLPFQQNATQRLYDILQTNSRAFLADEAGLGKTYSAAGVIYKLALDQWKGQGAGKETPFYALYIAPNRDLLKKNGDDIIGKIEDGFSGSDEERIKVKTLQDFTAPEDVQKVYKKRLRDASDAWYQGLAQKTEEDRTDYDCLCAALQENAYGLLDQKQRDLAVERLYYKCFKRPYRKAVRQWYSIAYAYMRELPDLDRIACAAPYMEAIKGAGKCIVLITLSVNLLFDDHKGSEAERELLGGRSRSQVTEEFLKDNQPGIILWDEYHRYHKKVHEQWKRSVENPYIKWEIRSHQTENVRPMKSVFISATPYQTNISGEESNELDSLYTFGEEEKVEPLPSFEEFARLYCAGVCLPGPKSEDAVFEEPDREAFEKMHRDYIAALNQKDSKATVPAMKAFEQHLKARMVRHERTRLQKKQEEHQLLYPAKELYRREYACILRNTLQQSRRLKEFGYSDEALSWGWNMPWILSFSAKNKHAGSKERSNYFVALKPRFTQDSLTDEVRKDAETLFAYGQDGSPRDVLRQLPEQSLALGQICRENLKNTMTQLLWVPPTVPLYKPAGIYETWSGYSKLLVFAEYQYLQRGGAVLLSDYAKQKNQQASPVPPEFPPALDHTHIAWLVSSTFSLTQQDFREKTLDELIVYLKQNGYAKDDKCALMLIASPVACAKYLGWDPQAAKQVGEVRAFEEAFNRYFRRDGVREALWAWICQRGYAAPEEWEKGILRYCAEGNLYAVLEEYRFACKGDLFWNLKKVLNSGSENNAYHPSKVFVQTLETSINGEDGKERRCSFADRLTSDVNDDGTGARKVKTTKVSRDQKTQNVGKEESEEVRTAVAAAFSSPFWPMVMFAGRGAQEGMDFHQYCLRIMHQTLPRGAVSLEQRQGRIDRYRSLLVRRRAAEKLSGYPAETTECLLQRMFAQLVKDQAKNDFEDNQIYPHWSIPDEGTKWHFQRMMPFWEFTRESRAANILRNMLLSYRAGFGVGEGALHEWSVDLSAPPVPKEEPAALPQANAEAAEKS